MIKSKKIRQKLNFQGQSAGTKDWFILYHEWFEQTLWGTRFLLKIYDTRFRGDTTEEYQKFGVQISNAKMNKKLGSAQKHH